MITEQNYGGSIMYQNMGEILKDKQVGGNISRSSREIYTLSKTGSLLATMCDYAIMVKS